MPDPIAEARRRNERTIATLVIAIGLFGMGIATWRMLTVEATQGLRVLLFAAGVVIAYFLQLRWRGPRVKGAGWLRATLECSAATVVVLIDLKAGPSFLVNSSTAFLYPLTIMVTSLRLDPRLTIYATVLAMLQHSAVYLSIFTSAEMQFGEGGLSAPRYYQELAFRLGVMATMGAFGTWLAVNLRREIGKASEEERVRTAFGHYVDASVVRRVLAGDLRIAPERRDVTVLFVDIRDFTQLSEKRDAGEVFKLLSGALQAFSEEVQRQGGIVNKYLGDGLLAIFGAPEPQPDHTRRAVRAALNIVAAAKARASDGLFPGLRIGVGIHAGEVVVGDLGGNRREFTAIGDVVNVASRIESANKELGTTILVTRVVLDRLGGNAVSRKLPPLSVRGRDAPVEVFELSELEATELSMSGVPGRG